jgi:hypothetical protein
MADGKVRRGHCIEHSILTVMQFMEDGKCKLADGKVSVSLEKVKRLKIRGKAFVNPVS